MSFGELIYISKLDVSTIRFTYINMIYKLLL